MPPKQKKGGAKKKESPEKRKARQEMEALAAQEAEQNRAELARVKLREQRVREEGYARANLPRVNAEWLQRMRALKLDELRNEASALAREHDREVDRRDRLAEGLLEELRVADDQHDAAAAAHLRLLEELLELQEGRMGALHGRFGADLRSIQEEFEREKTEMRAQHAQQRREAQAVVAALEASYAEAVQEAASTYQLAQDEVKGKCSEEYNVLKLALEQKVAGLEGQIEAQHQAYVSVTRQAEAGYQELSKADGAAQHTIAQQTQRLRMLQETLAQWRGRIVHNSREWERTNRALAGEKEAMIGHHSALKAALARFRQAQEQRLKQMSASSAVVQASLRERLEVAARILRAADLCRRHLLAEDLLPPACPALPLGAAAADGSDVQAGTGATAAAVPGSVLRGGSSGWEPAAATATLGGEAAASPKAAPLARPASSGALAACGQDSCSGLDGAAPPELAAFFQRLSQVRLAAAALEQQRLRLATENAALRAVLAKVEEGTTVTQEVLDDPLNTLVIVNSRLQQALRGSRRSSTSSIAAPAAATGAPRS